LGVIKRFLVSRAGLETTTGVENKWFQRFTNRQNGEETVKIGVSGHTPGHTADTLVPYAILIHFAKS
jgi:hypothetical protein